MNQAYKILENAERFNNSDDFLFDIYKIKSDENFDAFILSTSWTPEKIFKNNQIEAECLVKHSYFSSYRIKYGNFKIGWIQTAAGASNIIDSALCLAKSNVKKVIFIGAVGALEKGIELGEIATPIESYSFVGASLYLSEKINFEKWGKVVKPHSNIFIDKIIKEAYKNNIDIKKRKVFCTDSIACEYSHLDFIKNTGAELIEMETSIFYECMEMMEKNAIALLCVSDNSSAGNSLTKRTLEETKIYHIAREVNIPKLIRIVCEA